MSEELLVLILSIGFIILIIFVLVALGAMIKILIDVKKITGRVREETENISNTINFIGDKAKSAFSSSILTEKIIPIILGAIGAGVSYKKAKCDDEKTKKSKKTSIFTEEELD